MSTVTKLTPEECQIVYALLAERFPEWKYSPSGESSDGRSIFEREGMKFHIWYDGYKHRYKVSTWEWPKYTETTDRGYTNETRIRPNDLREPRGENCDITVSADKDIDTIARDIKRRFLRSYELLYNRCELIADERQQWANEARDGWVAVCQVLNADPKHFTHYGNIAGEYNATIENRSGKAHLKLTLTAEQLAKLIEALK
jgi:hypothetical protein